MFDLRFHLQQISLIERVFIYFSAGAAFRFESATKLRHLLQNNIIEHFVYKYT